MTVTITDTATKTVAAETVTASFDISTNRRKNYSTSSICYSSICNHFDKDPESTMAVATRKLSVPDSPCLEPDEPESGSGAANSTSSSRKRIRELLERQQRDDEIRCRRLHMIACSLRIL